VGGFANTHYWSSSEISATNANIQQFLNGTQGTGTKSGNSSVRAVRAF
jgi:hypothetical protein